MTILTYKKRVSGSNKKLVNLLKYRLTRSPEEDKGKGSRTLVLSDLNSWLASSPPIAEGVLKAGGDFEQNPGKKFLEPPGGWIKFRS